MCDVDADAYSVLGVLVTVPQGPFVVSLTAEIAAQRFSKETCQPCVSQSEVGDHVFATPHRIVYAVSSLPKSSVAVLGYR
jgi:hypothetical protein